MRDGAIEFMIKLFCDHLGSVCCSRRTLMAVTCDSGSVPTLRDGIDPDQALARIRRRKPSSDPLPHQLQDLRRWWRMRLIRGGS